MSTHKHTPGPWEVVYHGSRPTVEAMEKRRGMRCAGDKYPLICTMPDNYSDTQANASLIAAAPALLEALEAVEWAFVTGKVDSCPVCHNWSSTAHTANCKLGNAIKKVRGEE